MALPTPMPEPLVELIAQRFRLIGEPMRIRLLDRLRDGEEPVSELAETLGASQQNVSKHLGSPARGPASSAARRTATASLYSIADESRVRALREVCGGLREQARGARPTAPEVPR